MLLADVQFQSPTDLMATYAGRAEDLTAMTEVEINRDLNTRAAVFSGTGFEIGSTPQLYRKILSYRRFPRIY